MTTPFTSLSTLISSYRILYEDWEEYQMTNDPFLFDSPQDEFSNELTDNIELSFTVQKKTIARIKNRLDKMIHKFISDNVENIKQGKNKFVLLKVSDSRKLELSEIFYHDYEFLLAECCKIGVILKDGVLLDYYLSYFDISKYFESELNYYKAQRAFLQEDYETARGLAKDSIKKDKFNCKALLFTYQLYELGFFDKEGAIYNLIEAR